MSIYATWLSIEHPDDEAAELNAHGIGYGVIGDDSEDREMGSPWFYLGSHVLPSEQDPRWGSVGVSAIPDHITREGRDDGAEGPHDWLRLDVIGENGWPNEQPLTLKAKLDRAEGPNAGRVRDLLDEGVQAAYVTTILNRPMVQALRDTLTQWLVATERG